jgi:hypothetical protein
MDVDKAKKISDKYSELASCCSLIESSTTYNKPIMFNPYDWDFSSWSVKHSGMDPQLIYDAVNKLARDRKKIIEKELSEIE